MPIIRKFLDWKEPALPAVADFLIAQSTAASEIDLRHIVAVLPGGRAGRRLLELLVERAEQRGQRLRQPTIATPKLVPELLYESKQPFASDLVQKLAWAVALRSADREQVSALAAALPTEDSTVRWIELGDMLRQLHTELAADGLDFDDVAKRGAAVEGFREGRRWSVLAQVQKDYLKLLDSLQLWDLQTARLFAIANGECRSEFEIVLVGAVDMNQALRRMLDQVAARAEAQITALVHAHESLAERFDEHGCLNVDRWQDVELELQSERVHFVDGPIDQAEAIARCIAGYDGAFRADEISIGMAEERLAPQIERQLSQCNIATRSAIGTDVSETPPYQLLSAIADYAERDRFTEFAALVRHADLFQWASDRIGDATWLSQLDRYYTQRLQPRLGFWLGSEASYDKIRKVHDAVSKLLSEFAVRERMQQPVGDWMPTLLSVLTAVYGEREVDSDDPADSKTLEACRDLYDAAVELQAIPAELAPQVTAVQAIRLLLDQLQQTQRPFPDPTAIELLGWLELPLDDAPAVIVTTFNEGYVPKSVNSDLFLPNQLRRSLGVIDNARRYARDAYALSVVQASRRELSLIVARRDHVNDPLTPSRLLFATDAETIATRVRAFYAGEARTEALPPPLTGSLTATRTTSGFVVPQPQPLSEPIAEISVTAFRTYLACPYRFYLRHVVGVKLEDDAAEELDAPAFGSLMHDVLSDFGKSDFRDSTSADAIRDFLREALGRRVERQYGKCRSAPVNVQIEQLRTRLDAFAVWQAAWCGQGWRIEHSEVDLSDNPAQLDVDGESIALRGRIDRIDRHAKTGEWIVFDYKSGDKANSPEKTHREKDAWVDLQLPLYHRLVAQLEIEGDVKLGYILLPNDTSKVGEALATWSEDELAEADAAAIDVARRVLNQEFWPPTDPPPMFFSDYAAICQDGVFGKTFDRDPSDSESPASGRGASL